MNVQMGVSANHSEPLRAKSATFLLKIKFKKRIYDFIGTRNLKKRCAGLIPLDFLKLLTSPSMNSLCWEFSRCCLLANSIQN